MSDDGFHEIQLNGKQLVFLFMAATVVSVVIFLCGVMVGRGVRADRGDASAPGDQTAATVPATATPAPAVTAVRPPSEPPSPAEGEEVADGMTSKTPKDMTLKTPGRSGSKPAETAPAPKTAEKAEPPKASAERPEKPAPAAKAPEPPATAASKPSAPIAAPAAPGTVASGGFAVQITALRDRSEADAIVKRLAAKGYPAYVVNPLPGKPPVYRVQVGRFQERAEADRIASKLQKEEQFSPWVTR